MATMTEQSRERNRDVTMMEFISALVRYRRIVILFSVGAAILSVLVGLLLPKWFTATTKIMPPQQTQSNAVAILGQLGGLTGGVASQALGLKNPADIYVAMLKSRTVADFLIARFDLKRIYDQEFLMDARR